MTESSWVAMHPSLMPLAFNYVMQYTGDSEFIHNAYAIACETGQLPLPVAKGVIQHMCSDPYARRWLPQRVQETGPRPRFKVIDGVKK